MSQKIKFTNDGKEYEVDVSDLREVPTHKGMNVCSGDGDHLACCILSEYGHINIMVNGWDVSSYQADNPKFDCDGAKGTAFTLSEAKEIYLNLAKAITKLEESR